METPARQRIVFYVPNSAFDLAFGPRPIWLAGARGETVVAREVVEQRMPQHFVLTAAQHQGARVIVQAVQGDAVEKTKRALVTIEQGRQALVAISARKQPPRIAQGEHEQMDRFRLLADPDLLFAVGARGLLAGLGLEAYGREFRPLPLRPKRLQKTLHLQIAPGEPQAHQLSMSHHPVPLALRRAALDELGKPINRPGPGMASPGLPTAQLQPALYRFTIHTKFACNPLGSLAAFLSRHHLPHQISP